MVDEHEIVKTTIARLIACVSHLLLSLRSLTDFYLGNCSKYATLAKA